VQGFFRDFFGLDLAGYDDLHICRMLHAFVAVSHGRVVQVTEPLLEHCPLVRLLYRPDETGRTDLRDRIAAMTQEKIDTFGHFTARREILREDIAVPYGASEMMMFALRQGILDAAVVVCDGAGTVVTARPEVVQGIGARMNGLFYTSPIPAVIARLEQAGAAVVSPDSAAIDQLAGVRRAAKLGHRRIAVTVNGYRGQGLTAIRDAERRLGLTVTVVVVCTTGASRSRITEIRDEADMAWSCASAGVRELVGARSRVQVSTAIPVFAVTARGVCFLAGYSSTPEVFDGLDPAKQYLIAGNVKGTRVRMGNWEARLAEARLPVRSRNEPRPLTE